MEEALEGKIDSPFFKMTGTEKPSERLKKTMKKERGKKSEKKKKRNSMLDALSSNRGKVVRGRGAEILARSRGRGRGRGRGGRGGGGDSEVNSGVSMQEPKAEMMDEQVVEGHVLIEEQTGDAHKPLTRVARRTRPSVERNPLARLRRGVRQKMSGRKWKEFEFGAGGCSLAENRDDYQESHDAFDSDSPMVVSSRRRPSENGNPSSRTNTPRERGNVSTRNREACCTNVEKGEGKEEMGNGMEAAPGSGGGSSRLALRLFEFSSSRARSSATMGGSRSPWMRPAAAASGLSISTRFSAGEPASQPHPFSQTPVQKPVQKSAESSPSSEADQFQFRRSAHFSLSSEQTLSPSSVRSSGTAEATPYSFRFASTPVGSVVTRSPGSEDGETTLRRTFSWEQSGGEDMLLSAARRRDGFPDRSPWEPSVPTPVGASNFIKSKEKASPEDKPPRARASSAGTAASANLSSVWSPSPRLAPVAESSQTTRPGQGIATSYPGGRGPWSFARDRADSSPTSASIMNTSRTRFLGGPSSSPEPLVRPSAWTPASLVPPSPKTGESTSRSWARSHSLNRETEKQTVPESAKAKKPVVQAPKKPPMTINTVTNVETTAVFSPVNKRQTRKPFTPPSVIEALHIEEPSETQETSHSTAQNGKHDSVQKSNGTLKKQEQHRRSVTELPVTGSSVYAMLEESESEKATEDAPSPTSSSRAAIRNRFRRAVTMASNARPRGARAGRRRKQSGTRAQTLEDHNGPPVSKYQPVYDAVIALLRSRTKQADMKGTAHVAAEAAVEETKEEPPRMEVKPAEAHMMANPLVSKMQKAKIEESLRTKMAHAQEMAAKEKAATRLDAQAAKDELLVVHVNAWEDVAPFGGIDILSRLSVRKEQSTSNSSIPERVKTADLTPAYALWSPDREFEAVTGPKSPVQSSTVSSPGDSPEDAMKEVPAVDLTQMEVIR